MLGLILTPFMGWSLGTLAGAVADNVLPAIVISSLGVAIYGMFIAIIIPAARTNKKDFIVIILAAIFSAIFKYLLPSVSFGFAIIISALLAAVIGAILFPIKVAETEDEA